MKLFDQSRGCGNSGGIDGAVHADDIRADPFGMCCHPDRLRISEVSCNSRRTPEADGQHSEILQAEKTSLPRPLTDSIRTHETAANEGSVSAGTRFPHLVPVRNSTQSSQPAHVPCQGTIARHDRKSELLCQPGQHIRRSQIGAGQEHPVNIRPLSQLRGRRPNRVG